MALEALKQAKDALDKALQEKKLTQEFMRNLGPAVVDALTPILEEIAANSKNSKEELLNAISGITVNVPKADIPQAQVEVKIPEIKVPEPKVTVNISDIPAPKIPEIKIPAIKVPKPEVTVNVPPFPKIPDLQWPEEDMPVRGWVQLMGVDLGHPLPVQLRDAKGNPVTLFENLTQIVSGGGGVAAKIVKVSGIINSIAATITDSSGIGYSGSNPLPISGTVRPVQVRGSLTTAYATLTTGTATTLLQSGASTFNDLIYLVGANNSDVAVTVNISPGSAEGTVLTLQIPANGTAGIACPVPMPQNTAANAWTVDMGDITGTTVYLSALFSKET